MFSSGFDVCDTSDSLAIANNEIIAVNNLLNFNHWPVWSLADEDGGGTVDDYVGHTEYAES